MASATLPRRLSRAAARLLTLSRAAAAAAERDEERACWLAGQEGVGEIRGHLYRGEEGEGVGQRRRGGGEEEEEEMEGEMEGGCG
jgi:hypothetical protein